MIRRLHLTNPPDAVRESRALGVDPASAREMAGKTFSLCLRVEEIDSRSGDLLRYDILQAGGYAVIDRQEPDSGGGRVGLLLAGTRDQMERIALRWQDRPEHRLLGRELQETLANLSKSRFTLRFKGEPRALGRKTLVMGVINVTPDSFSDGGLYCDKDKAVSHGIKLAGEGADILDIGGESTRPGSRRLSVEEELDRVIPVVESLARETAAPLSIDTYKSAVAREAVRAGARMINDISGLGFDPDLASVAAEADIPLVLMHIRGTPETMQRDVRYDSLFGEILRSLKASIQKAESAGVDPGQIVVDPGIGFGKTVEGNLMIIKHLSELQVLGKPILLGTSRKSFIGRVLDAEVSDRLEGTLATIAIGVLNGAHIVRCHDVLQAKKAVALADAVRSAGEDEG